jgi:hypothetical protein
VPGEGEDAVTARRPPTPDDFLPGQRVEFLSGRGKPARWKPGVVVKAGMPAGRRGRSLRIRTSPEGSPGVWVVRPLSKCRHPARETTP